MANYIHHANQTLLWNMVNKLPDFQKLSPPKKDFEFKNTIEYLYNMNRHKPSLTLQELQQLNRETIMAFVKEKPPLYPQQPQQPQQSQQSQQPQQPQQPQQSQQQSQSPFPTFETKQEQSQRQFEERQNIYKQMNSKPDLPSLEIFKDKIEDTAIENMDALIQQYQKQREMEFQQYTPPPPISSGERDKEKEKKEQEPLEKKKQKLRMLDNNENVSLSLSLNAIDLDLDATANKKNVSWSTTQNIEYVIEDDYWEKKIMELSDKLSDKLDEANHRINEANSRINEANLRIDEANHRVTILENRLDKQEKQEVAFSLENIIQQIL
jgi:hypothetical protein